MIGYQAENHLFTLHTRSSSYQFMVDPSGYLLHTYYGPRVGGGSFAYRLRQADRGFSPNPNSEGHTRTFSLDTQPQEYPSSGVGDFRIPVLEVENADGSRAADLRYQSHVIRPGKYALPSLPAFFAKEEDAQTLEITLEDPVTGLRAVLYYGVIESRDMITRAVRIENAGDKPVALTRVMSLCLDLHQGDLDLITFDGRHTGERHPHRRRLAPGIQMVSSTRGATSHQHNNFIMLCAPDAGETHGWCLGAALVYSGNFEAAVERTQFDTARMTLGISPWQFRFTLAPGETFTAPEAVMIFSREGFSGMTHQFHRAIRDNLCRGEWAHRRRPVLLNTWEAAYFDFDSEKLLEIARCAAETGVELLVMDDGWFGTRNDDRGGLGDWFVNEQKLPGGLAPLVHAVNELGLDFGLWIEPEMVSEDSRLFAEHPDWALRIPGRPATRGRSQLVLDFSRTEVWQYVYAQIKKVLSSANITYVKWDMNRSLTDVLSAAVPAERQGEVYHRFVLGVYAMLEQFRKDFPHILLEGCCGGGGRFDCGMLYYTPQIWASDNTDAMDRLLIQYGTSFCYPVSVVGSHVSAVPNEQTGRVTGLDTRAAVAMAGTFGYELDPRSLSVAERQQMRLEIDRFQHLYDLIQYGDYDRLTDPFAPGPFTAWQQTAPDGSAALVTVVTGMARSNDAFATVYPRNLLPDALYSVNGADAVRGDVLMYGGIPLPHVGGDYRAMQFELTRQG